MPAMTDVICGNKKCRKTFQARTADVARGWGKFCSKSCKAHKQGRLLGSNSRLPRPDGKTPMLYKNCHVCGEAAVNGVYSPFGGSDGIEWLCERHMDTTHPFDSDNFNNT